MYYGVLCVNNNGLIETKISFFVFNIFVNFLFQVLRREPNIRKSVHN